MNNKIKILVGLFFYSINGYGQELPKAKSEYHIQINGTPINIIPPESFQVSNNFKGFQNPDDQTSMIMTMEIPGPYSEVSKGFNSEMLKTQGMDLKTKKEIQIAGLSGLMIELDQNANGMDFSKHILIYGNENSTTLVNGVFLKDSVQLGKNIKNSIYSIYVDLNEEINPRESMTYSLDESVGSLKFHSVIGNGMLFNRDLKTPTESEDEASLITDKSYANVEIENKELFCISRLKKYPDDYSVITSKGINEIEIDGLTGFELFAENNDKEGKEMYQVILFDDNGGYFLFVGSYKTGSDNDAISDIQSVIKTFKRKE